MNFVIQSTFRKENKLNWFTGIAILAFTFLFHRSSIGLNLGIFDLMVLLFWILSEPERFKESRLLVTALITATTAVCTAWYATPDTIFWSLVCLSWLSQQMVYPDNSILFFETKSFINFFTSPINVMKNLFQYSDQDNRLKGLRRIFFVVILPLLFVLFFAFLYSQFNPYFEEAFSSMIRLIDSDMLPVLFVGTFFCLYFFRTHLPARLNFVDQILGNRFSEEETEDGPKESRLQAQAGTSLFSMLDALLLVFLISDVAFVFQLSQGDGGNYSQYVHRGIGILILSIVIATSLIVFFFRGKHLSQLPNSDWLKRLALLWALLNIGLLLTTGVKNLFYVIEYGLTLKRIGVFVYLVLAFTGLIFAFLKVYRGMTNVYLFRNLYWSFFVILSINLCVDWSSVVTRFNIHEHIKDSRRIDLHYLINLNPRVLPYIVQNRGQLELTPEQADYLDPKIEVRVNGLNSYAPQWREASLAKLHAQSQLQAYEN